LPAICLSIVSSCQAAWIQILNSNHFQQVHLITARQPKWNGQGLLPCATIFSLPISSHSFRVLPLVAVPSVLVLYISSPLQTQKLSFPLFCPKLSKPLLLVPKFLCYNNNHQSIPTLSPLCIPCPSNESIIKHFIHQSFTAEPLPIFQSPRSHLTTFCN
jgi:hypothetical protein